MHKGCHGSDICHLTRLQAAPSPGVPRYVPCGPRLVLTLAQTLAGGLGAIGSCLSAPLLTHDVSDWQYTGATSPHFSN